jgi:integrase
MTELTNTERHEVALAIELIRANKLNLLDVVKEQVEIEAKRKKMAEVSPAVELFLKDKADMGNAATSMKTLRSIISRFALVFDGRLLDEVTHNEIKQWVASMGLATRTKNGYLKEVKNLYNWSIREGMAEVNPTQRIAAYRHSVEELEAKEEAKEILTVEEVDTMFKFAREECYDALPRMAIQLYAGTRPERESASIGWSNICLGNKRIHIPASKAKDRRERLVKICPKLYDILSVANCRNMDIQCPSWTGKWNSIKNSIGLLGQWPNSCTRHTFASYSLMEYGMDWTKEAMGHGNYDMLFKHYRTLVFPEEANRYFNEADKLMTRVA